MSLSAICKCTVMYDLVFVKTLLDVNVPMMHIYVDMFYMYMFIFFIFSFQQLRIIPILNGKCVLYSFESPPEVQIGVTFSAMEIPGIALLLVSLAFYQFGFLYKNV